MDRSDRYFFLALNFLNKRHKDLIQWIKETSKEQQYSLSAFCINILQKEFERQKKENIEWTVTEKKERE